MLIDALRARLGDPSAPSFRLMGEDLALLTADDVRDAVEDQLAMIPPELRAELLVEEADLAAESHRWLRKYNRSLYGRIAGYMELGERLDFRYPWPVVAILGIVQVLGGMDRARVYGLVGRAASRVAQLASRLGIERLAKLDSFEKLGDGSEDVLRRTNRGIFADSVPLVLRALRAEQLWREGKPEIAGGLLEGAAAVLWDSDCTALCTAITEGLVLDEETERFRNLALTTLAHFGREQQIFTHHIASKSRRKLPSARSLPAPVVDQDQLVWRPYDLPEGFDFRDHEARVEVFSRAFVMSVTGSLADYRVATDWVIAKFGGDGRGSTQRRRE